MSWMNCARAAGSLRNARTHAGEVFMINPSTATCMQSLAKSRVWLRAGMEVNTPTRNSNAQTRDRRSAGWALRWDAGEDMA